MLIYTTLALGVLFASAAVAHKKAQPIFQAADIATGVQSSRKRALPEVEAQAAAAGPLCGIDFQHHDEGPIAEQPDLVKALHDIGIKSIDFFGVGKDRDTSPVGVSVTPGQKLLCPLASNVAAVIQADATNAQMINVDSRGNFIIKLNQKVTHLFLDIAVVGGVDSTVQVTVVQNGKEGATLVDVTDTAGVTDALLHVGVAAAAPGGPFDELRITQVPVTGEDDGGSMCIVSVHVPCEQVKQVLSDDDDDDDDNGNPDDDDDDSDDDDDDSGSPDGHESIAHTVSATIDTNVDLNDLMTGTGPLCKTSFSSFDPGFAFDQLPDRLPHNGLKSITFVGEVDESTEGSLLATVDMSVGQKLFCSLADDTGAVVEIDTTTTADAVGTGIYKQQQQGAGMYVLQFTAPVSVAYVAVCDNTVVPDVAVGFKGIPGPTATATQGAGTVGAEACSVITVTSLDGVFDQVALDDSATGSGFCVAGVALPCEQLETLD